MAYRCVLLVEDEPVLRHIVARNLEVRGCSVRAVDTAAAALAAIQAERPDWLVLDLDLGDGDSWDLLRELVAADQCTRTVVLSAQRVSPRALAQLQPLAYLPKPFSIEDLLRLLECERRPARGAEDAWTGSHARAAVSSISTTHPTPLFVVESDAAPAKIARALLAQPDLAVTRISYVGLSARQAARLLATARCYYGLSAQISRSARGSITLTFSAPVHQGATGVAREHDRGPAPVTRHPSGTQQAPGRPWWRFWQRG